MKKIIEYSIYLLVFLLPWQTRYFLLNSEIDGVHFEYGSISFYASDFVLIALFFASLAFLYQKSREVETILRDRLWIIIACLDVFVFISLFFARDLSVALYRYFVLLFAFMVFALILYFPYQKTKLLISFALASVIQAGIAIVQFVNQVSGSSKWLGMAEHIPYESGTAVVEAVGNIGLGERWLRSYAALEHPNILGAYLSLALLFLFLYYIKNAEKFKKTGGEAHRKKLFYTNIAFYPLFLILYIGLFFSFSRAAWLSFGLGFFVYLIWKIIKGDMVVQKLMIPIVLYLGFMTFLLSIPFGHLVEARILSRGGLEKLSNNERSNSISSSKEVIGDNMLFGVGVGNYTIADREEYNKNENIYYYQPVHNLFLLVWAEIGIFGLLSFISLLVFALSNFSKKLKPEKTVLMLALFVLMMFDHWLWSLHFGVLFLFVILAMIVSFYEVEKSVGNMV